MPKPVFNPTQYELRNETPVNVSDEQLSAISAATSRVNTQLDWVAQALGWSGPNYWASLPDTVAQKRALLGGTFGVYNNYTLLRLLEIRSWENLLVTEFKPNVKAGQRVIIGDQLSYIYSITKVGETYEINIGDISDEILNNLELGAVIRVDCPQNRPFPFYRPEPLASGDADFRCSLGRLINENSFYQYYELVVSPFSSSADVLPYYNLQFYGGSYYYFDRPVYFSLNKESYVPWTEAEWVESKGLWQIYVDPTVIGNTLYVVWPYAAPDRKALAITSAVVIPWEDPSDWGYGGKDFNPVLDVYSISKSYNIAGLNYGLGTQLHLGDLTPQTSNPLWYDAGVGALYALMGTQWVEVGQTSAIISLQGEKAPPPATYERQAGTIWQDPSENVYVWDAGRVAADFYYFFSNSISEGFIFFDPNYQSVEGFYVFNPDNFAIHDPDSFSDGFYIYNCFENNEGFYEHDPTATQPDWYEIEFFNDSLFSSVFSPAYASNLYLLVDGFAVPQIYETDNYVVKWSTEGGFFFVEYVAKTAEGEAFVPKLTIRSLNTLYDEAIDISSDFKSRPEVVTSIPYNEIGVLNNFNGVWSDKGGSRPLDFVFDALDIHGFDEREALYLEPIDALVNFDWMLQKVSGKQVYVGDSPPSVSNVGDYYWNNETGALAVRYLDNDRIPVWVETNFPNSPCQLGALGCDYFPLKPVFSTGSCVLDNGDMWQDPITPGVALYYEGVNFNPVWVEVNWNGENPAPNGWAFSQEPNPQPDFSVLSVYLTDDFILLQPGIPYTTDDYTLTYSINEAECAYRFQYTALSDLGIQQLPTLWVGPSNNAFPPVSITEQVFSNAHYFIAPAVQNAGSTLRPWKTSSLEVTTTDELETDTFVNPLVADTNLGPGDENWDRSFIRLPSEYGRNDRKWNQTKLSVQDFTYAGTNGQLKEMKCPQLIHTPQIYEEVVFLRKDPSIGTTLYSEPYLYSSVEGIQDLSVYYEGAQPQGEFLETDFNFVIDQKFDEWDEANFTEYDALHSRRAVLGGDWEGIYLETTGNINLTGFLQRDLRVKSLIEVPAPIWDASIYKYPPLCPQSEESYDEDPNNCKVGYAYFAADLAAAEDGFFDQTQDVAWREPLVENQTLYLLNT